MSKVQLTVANCARLNVNNEYLLWIGEHGSLLRMSSSVTNMFLLHCSAYVERNIIGNAV